MQFIIVGGLGALFIYNLTRRARQDPAISDGPKKGTELPAPRALYANPADWTSAPVDITNRPYDEFYGPYYDPRKAYKLPGGTMVVHSGIHSKTIAGTNLTWDTPDVSRPETSSLSTGPKPIYAVGQT